MSQSEGGILSTRIYVGILAVMVAINAFMVGPQVESTLFPVLEEHELSPTRNGNQIQITGTQHKVRQCRAVLVLWTFVDRDGYTHALRRLNEPNSGPARVGPGKSKTKTVLELPEFYAAPTPGVLTCQIHYDCHSLWKTPYKCPKVTVTG